MHYHHKLYELTALKRKVAIWKFQSKRVVFTNGCFDILHPGHTTYLSEAKALGDYLVLGLNTDASVRAQNKSIDRPLNNELARASVLSALASVDAIILFGDETPLNLIGDLIPDVLVKGGDYNPAETDPNSKSYIVGSDIVKANGGDVQVITFVDGYSTTNLVNKIKNGEG